MFGWLTLQRPVIGQSTERPITGSKLKSGQLCPVIERRPITGGCKVNEPNVRNPDIRYLDAFSSGLPNRTSGSRCVTVIRFLSNYQITSFKTCPEYWTKYSNNPIPETRFPDTFWKKCLKFELWIQISKCLKSEQLLSAWTHTSSDFKHSL